MSNLIFKELSYKVVGLAYEIDNTIGFGQPEKVYSDCLEELLKKERINFKREVYAPIKFNEKLVVKRFFDFLIDDKIIVEVKVGNYQYRQVLTQVFKYLKANNLKLGIVLRFTKNGVMIKRVPNIRD